MEKIIDEELAKAGTMWHLTIGSTAITSQTKVSEPSFDATSVDGPLVTTKHVVLHPFTCKQVKGMTKIMGHSKWIHVVAEPLDEPILWESWPQVCMVMLLVDFLKNRTNSC